MFNSQTEVALDSVNLSDLVLQFKLMKAMGYKSLFDPEFRRELKNPYRKHLYYKILIASELVDRNILFKYVNDISDKLSFFSDPELYRHIKNKEMEKEVEQQGTGSAHVQQFQRAGARDMARHKAMTQKDHDKVINMLKKQKPVRSFSR